jgi:HlyD family secretion protein
MTTLRHSACRPRRGNTVTFTLVAITVVAGLASAGWWMFKGAGVEDGPELILSEVSRGPYDFPVIEQGTVESGQNTELRCQVRSRGGGGGGGERGSSGLGGSSTTILDVVPEGSMVKGPVLDENGQVIEEGEVVVKLDSAGLELEETNQRIQVSNRESLVAQAENTLKAALIARQEYEQGTFIEAEKLIKSELFNAEQAFNNAELGVGQAKSLHEKNIITGLQVATAEVALENARQLLDGARTKLSTLQNLTKQRMLTDHEALIKSAEANLKTQQLSLQLEQDKLRDIQDQIAKCTIRATKSGQVVYANQYDSFRGSSQAEFLVTPGAMVRERQVIVRLPDANDMQVKATVNEARVTLVRVGLPVTIRVDALKDEILEGEVTRVNPYAEAGGYSSGNIKKYATIIKIKNPPPDLRVGMNAEVRIHVERQADALQVPVQALAEVKGHFFSLVKEGEDYVTREVMIGTTNDKVATIAGGLKEGDFVVMNPRAAGGLLELPNLPDPTPAQIAGDVKRNDAADSPVILASTGSKGAGGKESGGPAGEGKGKRGGGANLNPAAFVTRYLESDSNNDGKLSKDEVGNMEERRRQALDGADKDGDGFLDNKELNIAAVQAVQKMREKMGGSGGGGEGFGGRGGGRRGGGEAGPPGAGPAGGGE